MADIAAGLPRRSASGARIPCLSSAADPLFRCQASSAGTCCTSFKTRLAAATACAHNSPPSSIDQLQPPLFSISLHSGDTICHSRSTRQAADTRWPSTTTTSTAISRSSVRARSWCSSSDRAFRGAVSPSAIGAQRHNCCQSMYEQDINEKRNSGQSGDEDSAKLRIAASRGAIPSALPPLNADSSAAGQKGTRSEIDLRRPALLGSCSPV